MPRDRDGDEYEHADRRGGSSSSKTIWIVLGVLGGLFLLCILGCIGIVGFGVFSFQKQMGGMIGSITAGEGFLGDLQGKRIEAAYASTSTSYKSTTSRKQFDEFLAKNPLLTTHAYHTQRNANLPMGNANRTNASISYVLYESGTADDENDPDDPDMKPKPAAPKKLTDPTTPKTLVITLALIEENGQWVVDKITVP